MDPLRFPAIRTAFALTHVPALAVLAASRPRRRAGCRASPAPPRPPSPLGRPEAAPPAIAAAAAAWAGLAFGVNALVIALS